MDWTLHWFEPRVANDRGFRTWAPTTKSWCWASAQVTMIIFLKPMHFIVKQNFYWDLKITSKRAILNVEKCQRLHGCGEWRHWDVEKSGHQGRIVITKFEPLSLFVSIHKKVSVLFWYLSKQVLKVSSSVTPRAHSSSIPWDRLTKSSHIQLNNNHPKNIMTQWIEDA